MRYRLLGKTGVRISEVALGTMTFGEDWGWGASAEVSGRMLDLFADAGGNVIDTADVYTNGTSETILGELLKGRRDRFVLACGVFKTPIGSRSNAILQRTRVLAAPHWMNQRAQGLHLAGGCGGGSG